jgi:hypothetical protein
MNSSQFIRCTNCPNKDLLSEKEFRLYVIGQTKHYDTTADAALDWGITANYLYLMLNEHRRFNAALLQILDFEKVIFYRKRIHHNGK